MNVLNLFSGCGGFSLGAIQAGFNVVAAIDWDLVLSSSYKKNFQCTELILADISDISGTELKSTINEHIDGIIGGPPCQGFSLIGRQDPNDLRRQHIFDFYRIVLDVKPIFFVMENVCGLASPSGVPILKSALSPVTEHYHVFGPAVWSVSDFGGATTRPRVFVLGTCKKRAYPFRQNDIEGQRRSACTVKHAIADLESAEYLGEVDDFDSWRIRDKRKSSNYSKALHSTDGSFTGHRCTRHTERVTRRFAELKEGQFDQIGRHPRLSWNGICPTLRAGTGPDRGSHMALRPIHPLQNRVITIREAARLQGFPDNHLFHPTKWHSFRMIGNSVSPIMSQAILTAIKKTVKQPRSCYNNSGSGLSK